jgi:hypothetical protein
LWGGCYDVCSQNPKHSHSSLYFPVSQHCHTIPFLQDCCQCSCLCFKWWRPCPSCPWRRDGGLMSKSWSLLDVAQYFTCLCGLDKPQYGPESTEHHYWRYLSGDHFPDLCFLFQQMKRLKTSMAVQRTDRKW